MSAFSGKEALFLLLVTIFGILTSVLLRIPLIFGLAPGFISLVVLSYIHHISARLIIESCFRGMAKAKIVLLILALVSILLPMWQLAGTINQLVTITLHVINPTHFFMLSFIAALCISMLLGTSLGTLSMIGVPLMGTAALLHLPMEVAAGAIISGAFVGDRTSPFSGTHQLLAHTIEIRVKNQQKAMFVTTLSAIILCIFFYSFLDFHFTGVVSIGVRQTFTLSFLTLMPPIILLVVVLARIAIIYAFLASLLSAMFIALYTAVPFIDIVMGCWHGVEGFGGGLEHTYMLLIFIAFAGAYNGLLEKANVIQPYLNKWLQSSQTMTGDTIKLQFVSILISLISANQTLPIIITGRSFNAHWTNSYGKAQFSRVMGDSTLLFPAMVPWSVLAIMCSTIVHVPLLSYLPYALFIWILPLLTIVTSIINDKVKARSLVDKEKIHNRKLPL